MIFDDWTWESLEEARDGEASCSETLTPAEAVAFFEEHFSGDLPIELAYQTNHPKPVTALFGNKVWQFDHKDWSLYGLASEYEDPMGETGYAYETWLFGAKDKFLTIKFSYHVGADVALDTQVELLTKDGAADFLKLNGYSLPEELRGFGKVATLNPDTMEHLPLSGAGASDRCSPQAANDNAMGRGSTSTMTPDETAESGNEARNNWIVDRYVETGDTDPKLAAALTEKIKAEKLAWTPLGETSIRDPLRKTFASRYGVEPPDLRGKKGDDRKEQIRNVIELAKN